MEDIDSTVMLREKLLTAGIDEILAHGIKNFSLRRVAAACGASCAAPYKHFKNKDEFIKETIFYVETKWNHLADRIISSVEDPIERISRLCIANIKFKISNPLYGMGGSSFAPKITEQILEFMKSKSSDSQSHKNAQSVIFTISALTAGTASLITGGKLPNNRETFEILKEKLLNELCSI